MSGAAGSGGGSGGMGTTLNSLLEKTSNWDKDERYMATNDLCNELQKDIKVIESYGNLFCCTLLHILVVRGESACHAVYPRPYW